MTCFMRYIGAKISSYNTMPCGVIFFVEFLLNECGNVLERKIKMNGKLLLIIIKI